MDRGQVHHVPVVGQPEAEGEVRALVVFDAQTGRRIGHSPHVNVEQTRLKAVDGGFTMTLKITLVKG